MRNVRKDQLVFKRPAAKQWFSVKLHETAFRCKEGDWKPTYCDDAVDHLKQEAPLLILLKWSVAVPIPLAHPSNSCKNFQKHPAASNWASKLKNRFHIHNFWAIKCCQWWHSACNFECRKTEKKWKPASQALLLSALKTTWKATPWQVPSQPPQKTAHNLCTIYTPEFYHIKF